MKIPDYPCSYNSPVSLPTPSCNPVSPEGILQATKELKQKSSSDFCALPFYHTLEANALTAQLCPLSRPNGATFYRLQELLALPPLDLQTPEITAILFASSQLLAQGEKVVFQLSGPLTILNQLFPLEVVFLEMIKHPRLVLDVFSKLGHDILMLAKLAESYGI